MMKMIVSCSPVRRNIFNSISCWKQLLLHTENTKRPSWMWCGWCSHQLCSSLRSHTFASRKSTFPVALLTYGAVSSSPAGQTFAVAVPVVTRGVVGTVNTHFRTQFAIVACWTNCKTHNVTKWPALVILRLNGEFGWFACGCIIS